jgi:hypothetical protein
MATTTTVTTTPTTITVGRGWGSRSTKGGRGGLVALLRATGGGESNGGAEGGLGVES